MPAPVMRATAADATNAISRSTGSTGRRSGWPLIMMLPPAISPRRAGLSATYEPYSTRNVTAAKIRKAAACRFRVRQKTPAYPSESNQSAST